MSDNLAADSYVSVLELDGADFDDHVVMHVACAEQAERDLQQHLDKVPIEDTYWLCEYQACLFDGLARKTPTSPSTTASNTVSFPEMMR